MGVDIQPPGTLPSQQWQGSLHPKARHEGTTMARRICLIAVVAARVLGIGGQVAQGQDLTDIFYCLCIDIHPD